MSSAPGYWFSSVVAMLRGHVIARMWNYPSSDGGRRCRSRNGRDRCMWEAGHPLARHMTFLSSEAWPKGPPQAIEWGKNPNPRGLRSPRGTTPPSGERR